MDRYGWCDARWSNEAIFGQLGHDLWRQAPRIDGEVEEVDLGPPIGEKENAEESCESRQKSVATKVNDVQFRACMSGALPPPPLATEAGCASGTNDAPFQATPK
jgi:hypothetical protein